MTPKAMPAFTPELKPEIFAAPPFDGADVAVRLTGIEVWDPAIELIVLDDVVDAMELDVRAVVAFAVMLK